MFRNVSYPCGWKQQFLMVFMHCKVKINARHNATLFIVPLPQLNLCTLVKLKSKSELHILTVKNGAYTIYSNSTLWERNTECIKQWYGLKQFLSIHNFKTLKGISIQSFAAAGIGWRYCSTYTYTHWILLVTLWKITGLPCIMENT